MPQVDAYGTQQPVALLKLFIELGGMYDRGKQLNWKSFVDIRELMLLFPCEKWVFDLFRRVTF